MKVLALTTDGRITYCTASEEDRGKGRCNHIMHQEKNEDNNTFIERANLVEENKSVNIKIDRYKMSEEEKESLPLIKGRKDVADEYNMGGRIETSVPLWNEMDKAAFSNISGYKKSEIDGIIREEMMIVIKVDPKVTNPRIKIGQLVSKKKFESNKEYYNGVAFDTGVIGLNTLAERFMFKATDNIYVLPYHMRQNVDENIKNPLNVLYNSLTLKKKDESARDEAQRLQVAYERLRNNHDMERRSVSDSNFYAMSDGKYPLKGLSNEFQGKGGIFRGILEGRNVPYTGRAVTTPDINMEYDNVGLPPEMIVKIFEPSIKETLSKAGHFDDEIKRWIGKYKNINQELISQNDRDELQRVVDVMGRRVVGVRQPTLHESNFLSWGVKVSPDNTIKQSPLNIDGLGADFDGDTLTVFALNDENISKLAKETIGAETTGGTRRPRLKDDSINKPQKEALYGLLQIIKKSRKLKEK